MPFNLFHGAAALIAVLIFLLWIAYFVPVHKIGSAVKRSRARLESEERDRKESLFFLEEGYPMFSHRNLNDQWEAYRSSAAGYQGKYEYTDIGAYFSPDTTLGEITCAGLASLAPLMVFLTGALMTALASAYYTFNGKMTSDLIMEAILLLALTAFLALCMAAYYRYVSYRAQEQLRLFCRWITQRTGAADSLRGEIAGIRYSMQSYGREQKKFYVNLSEHIAITTRKSVKPYLDDTRNLIESFVKAATGRQVESMQSLADHFVANTTKLYLEQAERIAEMTAEMVGVQAKTAETLESINGIYTESQACIRDVGDTTHTALARYDGYMTQIAAMQESVTSTVQQLQEMVDFITTNTKNQNFTIENLTSFQQDLLTSSAQSTGAMKEFMSDFKDQFSSSIIALRAASADMLKSGESLRDSYAGLSESVSADVDQTFRTFEENLATISVHLGRSIRDLQEAIDELPEILRQANLKAQPPEPAEKP